jgi:hypothetical protein
MTFINEGCVDMKFHKMYLEIYPQKCLVAPEIHLARENTFQFNFRKKKNKIQVFNTG